MRLLGMETGGFQSGGYLLISMKEPSSGELSIWDGAGLGCLCFTDTNFPFPGSVAIHSNWLLRGIPVNR